MKTSELLSSRQYNILGYIKPVFFKLDFIDMVFASYTLFTVGIVTSPSRDVTITLSIVLTLFYNLLSRDLRELGGGIC